MEYGFVIRYRGAYGMESRTADGGFASYCEAADAMSELWQEIEDGWEGCEPFDYDIVEE